MPKPIPAIRVGEWWYFFNQDSRSHHAAYCRFPVTDGDGWHMSMRSNGTGVPADVQIQECCSIPVENHRRYQSLQIGLAGRTGVLVLRHPTENYYTLHVIDLHTGRTVTSMQHTSAHCAISPDDRYVYYAPVTDAGAIRQIRKRSVAADRVDAPVMDTDPEHWITLRETVSRTYLLVRDGPDCTVIRMETAGRQERIMEGCRQLSDVKDFEHITTGGESIFTGYGADIAGHHGILIIPGEQALSQVEQWQWEPVAFSNIQALTVTARQAITILADNGQRPTICTATYRIAADGHHPLRWQPISINRRLHCGRISLLRPADPACATIDYQLECPACQPTTWHVRITTGHHQTSTHGEGGISSANSRDHSISFHSVQADDGQYEIPVTIITPTARQFTAEKSVKIALFVYGSYGVPLSLGYDPMTALLVADGIYAVYAHVRGGGEKGEDWHLGGKGRNKINTVHDYLAVASSIGTLIHADRPRIIGIGASAGGSVVAAALNAKPNLFAGAFLSAPFISPLRAVLDQSNHMRQIDKAEFGNPDDAEDLDALRRWSPLENIRDQRYPPIMIALSEHDANISNGQVMEYVGKLNNAGNSSRLITRKGATHTVHALTQSEPEEIRWIREL